MLLLRLFWSGSEINMYPEKPEVGKGEKII
jgi:hypothetical protein